MTCKICQQEREECICPECPQCGKTGQKICYTDHVLKLNRDQLIERSKETLIFLNEDVHLEEMHLTYLTNKPKNYCEDWTEL